MYVGDWSSDVGSANLPSWPWLPSVDTKLTGVTAEWVSARSTSVKLTVPVADRLPLRLTSRSEERRVGIDRGITGSSLVPVMVTVTVWHGLPPWLSSST